MAKPEIFALPFVAPGCDALEWQACLDCARCQRLVDGIAPHWRG